MIIVESRIRGIEQASATEQSVQRTFHTELDELRGLERVRVRVEPLGWHFVCRARLWRPGARTFTVRVSARSPAEAVARAAEAVGRRVRHARSREQVLAR